MDGDGSCVNTPSGWSGFDLVPIGEAFTKIYSVVRFAACNICVADFAALVVILREVSVCMISENFRDQLAA